MRHRVLPHRPGRISRLIICAEILLASVFFADASGETMDVAYEGMRAIILRLDYSDQVADDFVDMVSEWEDPDGNPVVTGWFRKLADGER